LGFKPVSSLTNNNNNNNKGEFYKYLGINQSNHIQHSIIKENLEKQFYLRIKSLLKSKLNGNNLIKAVNTYAVPLLTYSFGIIKWSKTNLQNINIQTRVLFTKFCMYVCMYIWYLYRFTKLSDFYTFPLTYNKLGKNE
jgi:hypothetical protein